MAPQQKNTSQATENKSAAPAIEKKPTKNIREIFEAFYAIETGKKAKRLFTDARFNPEHSSYLPSLAARVKIAAKLVDSIILSDSEFEFFVSLTSTQQRKLLPFIVNSWNRETLIALGEGDLN